MWLLLVWGNCSIQYRSSHLLIPALFLASNLARLCILGAKNTLTLEECRTQGCGCVCSRKDGAVFSVHMLFCCLVPVCTMLNDFSVLQIVSRGSHYCKFMNFSYMRNTKWIIAVLCPFLVLCIHEKHSVQSQLQRPNELFSSQMIILNLNFLCYLFLSARI